MLYLTIKHTPLETLRHELFDLSFAINATTFEDAYRSKFFVEKASNFLNHPVQKEESCQKFLKKNNLDALKGSDGFIYFWEKDSGLDYVKDLVEKNQSHFFDIEVVETSDDGDEDHWMMECFHSHQFGPEQVKMITKSIDPSYKLNQVFINKDGINPEQANK